MVHHTAPHRTAPDRAPNAKLDPKARGIASPQVWLALEEKDIPFDSIMINLQNKPDWYADVVPTKLVPAVSIKGEMVWESKDILLALEKAFPDSRPLMPRDTSLKAVAEELLAEMDQHGVDVAGFRFMAAGAPARCCRRRSSPAWPGCCRQRRRLSSS
jgi:glutathione S-transferase